MSRHRKKKSSLIDDELIREQIRRLCKEEVKAARHHRSTRGSTKRPRRESSSEDRPSKCSRSDSSRRSQKCSLNPRKKNPVASVEHRMEWENHSRQSRSRSRLNATSIDEKRRSVSRDSSGSSSSGSFTSQGTRSSRSATPSSQASTSCSFRDETPEKQVRSKEKITKDKVSEKIENNTDKTDEKSTDDTDKFLMGDITSKTAVLGPEIYPGIAERWAVICSEGLSKEERQKIIDNHPIPRNCKGLKAPILNPEVKPAKSMSHICFKKDGTKTITQNQIGVGLTALGKAMTILVHQKSEMTVEQLKDDKEFYNLFEHLCDAGKLFTDMHFYISLTRRAGVPMCVDSVVKKAGEGSKVNEFLFGKDFQEKLKVAQTVDKTSDAISTTTGQSSKHKQSDDKNYQRHATRSRFSESTTRALNYQAPSNQSNGSRRFTGQHRSRKTTNQGGQKFYSDRQRK